MSALYRIVAALCLALAAGPLLAVPPGSSAPADIVTATQGPLYLGQVASRTRFPGRVKTDYTDGMWRRADYIREDVTSVRLVYANFYLQPRGEVSPGFGLTIKGASVEYPAGVFTRATFSGSASATMVDGQAQLVSDPVNVSIPRGAQFWVQTRTSGNGYIYAEIGYRSAIGDRVALGDSTLPDSTMISGWSPGGFAGLQFGPSAIIANTRRPSVALFGDSRVQGVGDPGGSFASAAYVGELAPGLAPYFAILDLSQGGAAAYDVVAGGYAKRSTYLQYVSHGVIEYGINDVNSGYTGPQIMANRALVRALAPNLRWIDTTVTPQTTSTVAISSLVSAGTTATATIPGTQAAALKAGQTIAVAGAVPAGYNGTVTITAISGQQISYTLPAGASGLASATTAGTMSDLWASATFQTVKSTELNRFNLNEAVRAGSPGVDTYFELADGAESYRNSGMWSVPPQAPGVTTADGLHGNVIEWTQTQKAINPALVKRINAVDWRDLPRVPANDAAIERIAA